jgi:hypothetical protein
MGLTPDQIAELKRIAEAATLPEVLPGHWSTAEGAEMAREYAGKARSYLAMGDVPDLALANAVFLADRYDLQLIRYQQAAKERIRWLSVQLALANARIEALEGALKPFAEVTHDFNRGGDFDLMLLIAEPGDIAHLSAEEFRRAANLLGDRYG